MTYLRFFWTLARGFAVIYVTFAGIIAGLIALLCFAFWTTPSFTYAMSILPLAARLVAVITGSITLVWIFDRDGGRSEWKL